MNSLQAKIYFLLNCKSGAGLAKPLLKLLDTDDFKSQGIYAEEIDFTRLAQQLQIAQTAEVLVLGGGDGTISGALEYIINSPTKIAVLPLGTANDLAREINISKAILKLSPEKLIKFYQACGDKSASIFSISYGPEFSQKKLFINYASFGYEASVVKDFATLRQKQLWSYLSGVWSNRLAYGVLGAKYLLKKLDGIQIGCSALQTNPTRIDNCPSILFTNISNIMGLGQSNRLSSAFDENLECLIAKNLSNCLGMLTRGFIFKQPQVLVAATQFEISGFSQPPDLQIDGESLVVDSLTFKLGLAGKIKLLTN